MFGVPSVVSPLAFDQFKNARVAAKLGIASKATPETMEWNSRI
jgi:UDP:flavonoid glycosyltransferase YjiC (YdhE family)